MIRLYDEFEIWCWNDVWKMKRLFDEFDICCWNNVWKWWDYVMNVRYDIEMMFEKWWNYVMNVRYDIEVMLEKCFEEHWIVLSFYDIWKRMWKEHDIVWKWEPACMVICTLSTSSVDALA
jgi:hypothetical protein